jgi:hypothetical protein
MGAGCFTSECQFKCHEKFDGGNKRDIFNSSELGKCIVYNIDRKLTARLTIAH